MIGTKIVGLMSILCIIDQLKVDVRYVNPPIINYGNYTDDLGYISPYKLSRDSGKYSLGLLKPSVRFKIRDSIVNFFKEYSYEN